MYTAKERLMLDENGKVVKEGDPRARRLLVAKGQDLSDEEAKKHGLLDPPAPAAESEADKGSKKKEHAAVALPLSDEKPAEKVTNFGSKTEEKKPGK